MWCLVSQANSVILEVQVDPKAIGQECLEKTRNRSNFILTNALAEIWSTVTEMMETKFHLDLEIARAENVFKLRSEKVCRGKLVEMFTRS